MKYTQYLDFEHPQFESLSLKVSLKVLKFEIPQVWNSSILSPQVWNASSLELLKFGIPQILTFKSLSWKVFKPEHL